MSRKGRPKKNPEAVKMFAETLNRILAELGITQAEVAEALGLSQQVVSAWCRGIAMPSRKNIKQLAEFLGKTVEYLKTGGSKMENAVVFQDDIRAEEPIDDAVIRKIAETFSEAEVSMTVDALNGIRRVEGLTAVSHLVANVGYCIHNEGIAAKWNVENPQGYIDKLNALSEAEAEAFIALVIRFWNAPEYRIPSVGDRLREVGLVQGETLDSEASDNEWVHPSTSRFL